MNELQKKESEKIFLTTQEVADMLHITKESFGRVIAKKIPRAKVGTCFLYQLKDVVAYIESIKTLKN